MKHNDSIETLRKNIHGEYEAFHTCHFKSESSYSETMKKIHLPTFTETVHDRSRCKYLSSGITGISYMTDKALKVFERVIGQSILDKSDFNNFSITKSQTKSSHRGICTELYGTVCFLQAEHVVPRAMICDILLKKGLSYEDIEKIIDSTFSVIMTSFEMSKIDYFKLPNGQKLRDYPEPVETILSNNFDPWLRYKLYNSNCKEEDKINIYKLDYEIISNKFVVTHIEKMKI